MPILQPNQSIGKYEVKRLIKENHYCETYRVEDDNETPFFLKLYVIKNMPEKMLTEEGKVKSIIIASRLKHKNLISFVESGDMETESVGRCQYVVTDYCSGGLLADHIAKENKLNQEVSVAILKNILCGLAYMHEQHFYHNDITPRNIMISKLPDGEAELIDLGHVSGFVGGAPPFDTSDLDERYQMNMTFAGLYGDASDLFSALAVFYTMLTDRVPWDVEFPEGSDRKQRMSIVKEKRKTALNLDDVEADEGIKRILAKGLGINGSCGYKTVKQLLNDLEHPDQVEKPDETSSSPVSSSHVTRGSNDQQATEAQVEIQKGKGNGFKDIAGMSDLKQLLSQKVIFILKDKERAQKYKLTPPNGMLLYGPPGCGKSFFAEKFAEESGFNFILVKASDLGSIYIHGTLRLMMPNIFEVTDENREVVLKALNETNSTMKVVKAYTPISDAVWIGFEVLIDSTPVLADFVPRGIKMLRAGQEHFYEALQAG